jgi:hypothetical protein
MVTAQRIIPNSNDGNAEKSCCSVAGSLTDPLLKRLQACFSCPCKLNGDNMKHQKSFKFDNLLIWERALLLRDDLVDSCYWEAV